MTRYSRQPEAGGYTLLELLIVVAVLAAVLGMGAPALRKFSEKGQLQDAARQLRAKLLAARLAAIETGSPAYFHYQLGSGTFAVITLRDAQPGSELLADPLLDESAGEALAGAADRIGGEATETLPSEVRFVGLDAEQTLAEPVVEDDGAGGGNWSPPLIFYPNGRALNAEIRLASNRYQVGLTVRGLTGTVQISQVERMTVGEEAAERLPEVAL